MYLLIKISMKPSACSKRKRKTNRNNLTMKLLVCLKTIIIVVKRDKVRLRIAVNRHLLRIISRSYNYSNIQTNLFSKLRNITSRLSTPNVSMIFSLLLLSGLKAILNSFTDQIFNLTFNQVRLAYEWCQTTKNITGRDWSALSSTLKTKQNSLSKKESFAYSNILTRIHFSSTTLEWRLK